MLASGNFVAPLVANHVENGELVPDKPPLFHWIAAGATWARAAFRGARRNREDLAEAFDEWTLRFPSALAGVGLAAALAILGAAFVGERAAYLAAGALLTSPQFVYQSHFGRVDALLACLVTLAILLAGRAILAGTGALVVLAGVASGGAVLAKGPLGLVLPSLACAGYVTVEALRIRGLPAAARLPWLRGAIAAAAVALPWYVLASVVTGGAVVRSQLFAENLDQFTGAASTMRPGFYLQPWLFDSLPWNLVALAALVDVWRSREAGARFCAVWWIALLAFFEIAAYKRRAYLLPALPAEALLAGWFLDRRFLGAAPARSFPYAALQAVPRPALLAAIPVAAACLGYALWPLLVGGDSSTTRSEGAIAAVAVVVASVAIVGAARLGQRREALAACFAALAALYAGIAPIVMTVIADRLSVKRFVARVEAELPQNRGFTTCGIGADTSLVLLFYVRRPDAVTVLAGDARCPERPGPGLYLLSEDEWRRLAERVGRKELWRERLRGEIRGWSARTPVVFAERLVPAEKAVTAGAAPGRSSS